VIIICRTARERTKMTGKITDRSISPLPNPPSIKLSNKLAAGSFRSQSPSQAGKPPKKKKKANNGPVVKEESTALLQVTSHDPVTHQDVSRSHHKTKSDHPKPPSSSYTTSHASFSSSLSSSESDMEEVSMPTVTHGNIMVTAPAEGNDLVETMKGNSNHDSSSSSSASDSSESQSDDDDDEVMLCNM